MRISYQDHVTNEEVLRRTNSKRSLRQKITKRKLQYFGHIIRREDSKIAHGWEGRRDQRKRATTTNLGQGHHRGNRKEVLRVCEDCSKEGAAAFHDG